MLELRAGEQMLELALDHCVGTRLTDGRVVEFDEVELEVKQGGETALLEAQDAFAGCAVAAAEPGD